MVKQPDIEHGFFDKDYFEEKNLCFIMFHPSGEPVLVSYISNCLEGNDNSTYVGEVIRDKYCTTKSLEDPKKQIEQNKNLKWKSLEKENYY